MRAYCSEMNDSTRHPMQPNDPPSDRLVPDSPGPDRAEIKRPSRKKAAPAELPTQTLHTISADPDRLESAKAEALLRQHQEQDYSSEAFPEIPGFVIERALGMGGMGMVYLAKQTALNRQVAIKVLKPELVKDRDFTDRFLREAAVAAKLSNNHIIQIYDAGEHEGLYYMAFEFIPGGDLSDAIKKSGTLPEFKALAVIADCIRGLQGFEQAGLVHRDIKPGNIFLNEKGNAVIGDLGLARTTSGEDIMTMTGFAMGTPSYMSPEHISGNKDLDIRSDIYALGATLYKMITGEEPFSGETVYAITHKVLADPLPDPRLLNAHLSEPMVAIIQKAMHKDREQRYQNCQQFLQDVEAALHGGVLLHAAGAVGQINGVEAAKATERLLQDRAQAATPRYASAGSGGMRLPSRGIMMVLVLGLLGAWFYWLVTSGLKVDRSRFQPDWAHSADKDHIGYYADALSQDGTIRLRFRYVRAGEFMMGSPEGEEGRSELETQRSVSIAQDFWICDQEVSQKIWERVMENQSAVIAPDNPAENMSLEEVREFLAKVQLIFADMEGARLPSEEEWEFACRAGTTSAYSGNLREMAAVASPELDEQWQKYLAGEEVTFEDVVNFAQGAEAAPKSVKSFGTANALGLFDMHGNVREWTASPWIEDGEEIDDLFVVRGGSWFDPMMYCRSASREAQSLDTASPYTGFRFIIPVPHVNK